jgi:hypothetical protein
MPKITDITGETFNRLTVVRADGRNNDGKIHWRCHCVCGNETLATAYQLKSGHKKSCGCWRVENGAIVSTRHGGAKRTEITRLYRIWGGMLNRCSNPNNQAFPRYGGRGISVCDDWHSFPAFRDWAEKNGYQDDLAIDRIDNDGNYEPSNCRWATYKEQGRNQPQNRAVIRSDGRRFAYVADAAQATGTTTSQIASAIRRNGTSGGFGWRYDEQQRQQSTGSASRA